MEFIVMTKRVIVKNKKSACRSHIGALALVTKYTQQGKFYKKILIKSKDVKIQSYKSNIELETIIKNFLKRFEPKIKECYETAFQCSFRCPEIEYVEGYADLSIPLAHAWNYYKGIHFDLTAELALGRESDNNYLQLIKLDNEELLEAALKTKRKGEFVTYFFFDKKYQRYQT
jgi:hypothetical protein